VPRDFVVLCDCSPQIIVFLAEEVNAPATTNEMLTVRSVTKAAMHVTGLQVRLQAISGAINTG